MFSLKHRSSDILPRLYNSGNSLNASRTCCSTEPELAPHSHLPSLPPLTLPPVALHRSLATPSVAFTYMQQRETAKCKNTSSDPGTVYLPYILTMSLAYFRKIKYYNYN